MQSYRYGKDFPTCHSMSPSYLLHPDEKKKSNKLYIILSCRPIFRAGERSAQWYFLGGVAIFDFESTEEHRKIAKNR